MICPVCRSAMCRRSKRRGARDYFCSVLGMRPWRCQTCQARFQAWTVAAKHLLYAHCARCGNTQLLYIPQERVVEGKLAGLRRLLRVPAYRCEPCRRRFFSLRKYHPIAPSRGEASSAAPQAEKHSA